MVQKVPPPTGIATKDPVFNRWLLELTAILNSAGEIDPGSIAGLAALVIQVAAQGAAITALQGQVTALQTTVGTHTGQIAALTARAQVFRGAGAPAAGLGSVNDWYGDVAGAVGARIFIKTAVGVWTPFPF